MGNRPAVQAYVALGANMGDAAGAIRQAIVALGHLPLTQPGKISSLYRTRPLNTDGDIEAPAPGDDYLNAVMALQTRLSAPALLAQLQRIEQSAGRQRSTRNAPRTLDLDLLLYGSAQIDSAVLMVPHPRMKQRAFVLVPLAEIEPALVDEAALRAVAHQPINRVKSDF